MLNEIINKQRIELNKQNNMKILSEGQKQVNATAENNLRCMTCNKVLSRRQRLIEHERTCDGVSQLQCKVCLKVFTTREM